MTTLTDGQSKRQERIDRLHLLMSKHPRATHEELGEILAEDLGRDEPYCRGTICEYIDDGPSKDMQTGTKAHKQRWADIIERRLTSHREQILKELSHCTKIVKEYKTDEDGEVQMRVNAEGETVPVVDRHVALDRAGREAMDLRREEREVIDMAARIYDIDVKRVKVEGERTVSIDDETREALEEAF